MKVRFERLNIRTQDEWRQASYEDGAFMRDNRSCWVCSSQTKFMYPMLPIIACSACWELVEDIAPQVYDRWCQACNEFNIDKELWRNK